MMEQGTGMKHEQLLACEAKRDPAWLQNLIRILPLVWLKFQLSSTSLLLASSDTRLGVLVDMPRDRTKGPQCNGAHLLPQDGS
jgi:hypothetical protein